MRECHYNHTLRRRRSERLHGGNLGDAKTGSYEKDSCRQTCQMLKRPKRFYLEVELVSKRY